MPESKEKSSNTMIIHIASETLVAMCITYYLMSKNKELVKNLEILNRKLTELDSRVDNKIKC